jgi:F-type H+-transporting ATPase subunit b
MMFGTPITAAFALALLCFSSQLSAQEPEREPDPPIHEDVVEPPAPQPTQEHEPEPSRVEEARPPEDDEPAEPTLVPEETAETLPADVAAEAADEAEVDAEEALEDRERHAAGAAAHHEAGHGGGHAAPVTLLGWEFDALGQFYLKLANFLIFAALLIMMLWGALSRAFKARAADIEMKLLQSERDRWDADAQLRELDNKMSGLEGELAGILEKAEADAEVEKQRILEAARFEADQIMVQARAEIEHQRRQAKAELRELVSKLAVEGAERRISQKVSGDTASWVMDQAIRRVGGAG